MKFSQKNAKYRIALAASVLAGITVLAGCGSDEAEPAASAKPGQSAAATAGATPAPRGKITSTIYERGGVAPEEGTKTENRWTRWINENGPTDVTFVAVPRWESAQKLNTLFASGSAPDVIMEYDMAIKNQLYNQKLLMPLDDAIEKYSTTYKDILKKYPILEKLSRKDDGKIYEIGRVENIVPQHNVYIRTDWLAKLNLSMPKTVDEFFQVAQAFAEKDPDGNGKKDTYGVSLSFVGGMAVDDIFGIVFNSIDKNPWVLNDKGELVFGWDRIQSALEFKKKLYEAGIVDKDYLTDGKGDKAKQDFVNGKLGIYGANGSEIETFKTLKKNNPAATIAALPLPAGPYGTFSPLLSTPVNLTTVVNAKAKDPEAIIKYVDFMMSEKATKTFVYGIEGEHYKIGVSGCPEVIDAEKNKIEKSYNTDFTMINNAITDKCSSVNIVLNPVKPAVETPETLAAYELSKEFAQVYQSAFDAYQDPAKPMIGVISSGSLPALPQDLQINQTNGYKTVNDILAKGAITPSYSAAQAIKDAKAAWETSNGAKVDAWYKEWFAANKDKILLTKDYYDFLKK
ncbi:extracellular solute-binding protein [Paenibacillus sp. YN15]|uniref:extracellular solute-binding protein n=1 Tax=Paenibacillus sp. YN15 TaxID=1742774 RepID=UPI000DCC4B91|nr:extracellular solute-binding protein [Paenibacillus sp. YN15]RAU92842.1 ABC transporter substrate-binding protein [Paenibacillus sp. YN15]